MKIKNENKKYTKNTKIYIYATTGSGRWSSYKDLLKPAEIGLLNYACRKGYAVKSNSAPRGGKWGEHYLILKYFTTNSLTRKAAAEKKAFDAELAKVLKSEKIYDFRTISDIGKIVINNTEYSNFWGDGYNTVEVCEVDADAFKTAEYISRRQVYNAGERITIVKFDAPETLVVEESDCRNMGVFVVANSVGFCVWERKAKIFVEKTKTNKLNYSQKE